MRRRKDEGVTPRLQRVLDALQPCPALIRTAIWNVVAWNRAATVMLTDYGAMLTEKRNILRFIFLDPRVRAAQYDWESVARLIHPLPIAFDEAIPIATLGLGINLLSAWLLRDDHDHDHRDHGHDHQHSRDLNLRAAYVHVLADAAVSILAVIGLVIARELDWLWIDAAMGIIGAAVIANWALALVRAAGAVLLDIRPNAELVRSVRECLEDGSDRVADLHLWRIGPRHNAVVATIVSHEPQAPSFYKERLANLPVSAT